MFENYRPLYDHHHRHTRQYSKDLLGQLLELIETGSQVDPEGLEERIMNAELIALLVGNDKIVTTAT